MKVQRLHREDKILKEKKKTILKIPSQEEELI